jgi:hypothetical protein
MVNAYGVSPLTATTAQPTSAIVLWTHLSQGPRSRPITQQSKAVWLGIVATFRR